MKTWLLVTSTLNQSVQFKLCKVILATVLLTVSNAFAGFYPSSDFLGTNFNKQTNAANARTAIAATGFQDVTNIVQSIATGGTNFPYTAITNSPWVLTNDFLSASNILQIQINANTSGLQFKTTTNDVRGILIASNFLQTIPVSATNQFATTNLVAASTNGLPSRIWTLGNLSQSNSINSNNIFGSINIGQVFGAPTTNGFITSANGGNAALATNLVSGASVTNLTIYGTAAATNWFSYGASGQLNTNTVSQIGRNMNLATGKETFLGTNGSVDYIIYTPSNNTALFIGNGGGLTNVLTAAQSATLANALAPQYNNPAWVSTNYFPNILGASPQYTFVTYGLNTTSPMLIRQVNGNSYYLNEDQDSIQGNQYVFAKFIPPVGTTNTILSASFIRTTSTGTGIRFGLYDDQANAHAGGDYTVGTSTFTNVVVTNTTRSINECLVLQNTSGVGTFIVSNLTLQFLPAPTNLALTVPYYRYETHKRNFRFSQGVDTENPTSTSWDSSHCGPQSLLRIHTTAPYLTFEMSATYQAAPFYIYTNGVLAKSISMSRSEPYELVDLPLSSGGNIVEVRNPFSGSYTYSSVRAVFAPQGYAFSFEEFQSPDRIYLYGDSIFTGLNETTDYWKSFKGMLENYTEAEIGNHVSGGESLFKDYFTNSSTSWRSLHKDIASFNPTMVWVEMGYNDKALVNWGGTNAFANAYAMLLDTIHSNLPAATVFAQSPIWGSASIEASANGAGNTLAQYRLAVSNNAVAVSRTNWCVYVDGPQLVTTNNLGGDGIHPNSAGHAQQSKRMGITIRRNYWR